MQNFYISWMEAKLGDRRHAEFIPPSDLDLVLARFFLSPGTPDLTEYELESINPSSSVLTGT